MLAGGTGVGLALARRRPRPLFWVTGLAVAVAVFVVLAPRHGFRHYLIYLALPLTCWVAASLAEVRTWPAVAAFRAGFYALAGLVIFGGQLGARLVQPPPFLLGRFTAAWQRRDDGPGRLVRRLMRPGDTLARLGDDRFAAQQFLQMVITLPQRRAMGLGAPMSARELREWPAKVTDRWRRFRSR